MSILTRVLAAGLALAITAPLASAQTTRVMGGRGQQNTIQSSIALSLPLDSSKSKEERYEEGLRVLYRVAARSCTIVLETVASSCVITSISNSVQTDTQMNGRNGAEPAVAMNISISMAVEYKDAAASPAP